MKAFEEYLEAPYPEEYQYHLRTSNGVMGEGKTNF